MSADYSYQKWEKERNIGLVCDKLLDNADLEIQIQSYPLSINFTFYVVGSDIKVKFICEKIERFEINKDYDEESMFVVLETHVLNKINYSWEVKILPTPEVHVICRKFSWSIEKLTESEKNK